MTLEIALDTDEEWDSSGGEPFDWRPLVKKAAEAAIAESSYPELAQSDRPIEISVALSVDGQVRALNAKWRGQDKATNVLSFPMADERDLTLANVSGVELLLGDIVLAHGVCEAEAAKKGVSFQDHALHLLVHGTLHLLGYDHHDDRDAADMEAREVRALKRLGIANPYGAFA
ncbi:MAG TPA: rRNA maturation RNase YbeY [Sphingomicrobium sp.]|jgi:probable rRNA maturation factor|nr:rRNA maturation RNase YbeY [Sphingomicrobium sp.]